MKKSIIFLGLIISLSCLYSCSGCSSDKSTYDDEYWKSVSREKAMKDAGLDDAADREQKERRDKLKGKTNSGNTYQGSQKQKDDLDAIDEYMKNNPDF